MDVRWWLGTLTAGVAGWTIGFVATLEILFSQPGATLDLAWSLGISDAALNLILLVGAALGTSAAVGLLRGLRAAGASLVAGSAASVVLQLSSDPHGGFVLGPSVLLIVGAAAAAAKMFPRPHRRPRDART